MAITTHPATKQPAIATKVWRYMSLPKLIGFLTTESLFFCKASKLSDRFEGSLTEKEFQHRYSNGLKLANDTLARKNLPPLDLDTFKEYNRFLYEDTFINCWNASESESEAMWKLYCGEKEGVAIKTSYGDLVKSIPDDTVICGQVEYVNYETGEFEKKDNVLSPFFYKRISFSHENEIRLIKPGFPDWPFVQRDGQLKVDWSKAIHQNKAGIQVSVKMDLAMKSVCVNPYADQWYGEVVNRVVGAIKPKVEVLWSEMRGRPLR